MILLIYLCHFMMVLNSKATKIMPKYEDFFSLLEGVTSAHQGCEILIMIFNCKDKDFSSSFCLTKKNQKVKVVEIIATKYL